MNIGRFSVSLTPRWCFYFQKSKHGFSYAHFCFWSIFIWKRRA